MSLRLSAILGVTRKTQEGYMASKAIFGNSACIASDNVFLRGREKISILCSACYVTSELHLSYPPASSQLGTIRHNSELFGILIQEI